MESKKEIILVSSFGRNFGEAITLSFLLEHPDIDVKLLVLRVDDPKKDLPVLFKYLLARGEGVPLCVTNVPFEGVRKITGASLLLSVLFPSINDAFSSVLPRMDSPFIFLNDEAKELHEVLPLLDSHPAKVLLSSLSSKQTMEDAPILNHPSLSFSMVLEEPEECSSISDGERKILLQGPTPSSLFLSRVVELCFEKGYDPFSLKGLLSAWTMAFPKNFVFEPKTIQGKSIHVLSEIHKVPTMKEITLFTLTKENTEKEDLQIVEFQGRYRIVYPRIVVSQSLFIYETGWEIHRPGDVYGPVARTHHFLHAVIEGEGSFIVNGVSKEIHAGDVFLFPANIPCVISASSKNPHRYAWVGFGGKDAENIIQACGFSQNNGYVIHPPKVEEVIRILLAMSNSSPQNGVSYYLLGLFYEALSYLNFATPLPKKKDFVKEAIETMEENFQQGISIEEVCAYVHVERSYFYRRFQKEMGCSPSTYLTTLRIEKAKEMLREKDKSFSYIAKSVGFHSYSAFARAFSLQVGMSPREYQSKAFS